MTDNGARFIVIMAGGAGTRFWPASRAARPKQLLALGGRDETLLQAAVRRAEALVGADRVLVVTSERHAAATREQLPRLPPANVLLEPSGRNTAPCIAWAVAHVERRDPRARMGVLPADPHVGDEAAFARTLEAAFEAAAGDSLVTIGVTPTRAETGYGYLEVGKTIASGVRCVDRFVEKPDAAHAEQYLASGRHLWNSGMFFFGADVMHAALAKHMPELDGFIAACNEAAARGAESEYVRDHYARLPAVSIDYGVMEKAADIVALTGDFGWDDIGSWSAAWELADKDAAGNAAQGRVVLIDSRGCYVSAGPGKLVALLGVEDLVVVDTRDALLIMPRERAQDVRAVVAALQDSGEQEHL